MLVFYLSVKSLTSIAISQLIRVLENTISNSRILLHTRVADWLVANASSLADQGSSWSWTKLSLGRRNTTKAITGKDSGFLEVWTLTVSGFLDGATNLSAIYFTRYILILKIQEFSDSHQWPTEMKLQPSAPPITLIDEIDSCDQEHAVKEIELLRFGSNDETDSPEKSAGYEEFAQDGEEQVSINPAGDEKKLKFSIFPATTSVLNSSRYNVNIMALNLKDHNWVNNLANEFECSRFLKLLLASCRRLLFILRPKKPAEGTPKSTRKKFARRKRSSAVDNNQCTLCHSDIKKSTSYVTVYSDTSKNSSTLAGKTFESIVSILKGHFPGEKIILCQKDYRNVNQVYSQYIKVRSH